MKRYFKILDTEENRDMFDGLIGKSYEMKEVIENSKDRPELEGMYILKIPGEDELYFSKDEVEEIK